jgi:hypothetical protein
METSASRTKEEALESIVTKRDVPKVLLRKIVVGYHINIKAVIAIYTILSDVKTTETAQ